MRSINPLLVFMFLIFILILGCEKDGKEGPGSKNYYTEIYFKNGLEKNIVLKGYSDPSISKYVYTYTIAQNETIRIMQYYLPQKIEIYDEEKNELISTTNFSGTKEELENYPRDRELKVVNYETKVTPDDQGVLYLTKITLTQNLEHEVWK